jgi:hypothetical protein
MSPRAIDSVVVDGRSARYNVAADAYVNMFGDAVDDPATNALLELVGDARQMRLLDAPCGEGRVAQLAVIFTPAPRSSVVL